MATPSDNDPNRVNSSMTRAEYDNLTRELDKASKETERAFNESIVVHEEAQVILRSLPPHHEETRRQDSSYACS